MANSYVELTANGSATSFSFSFSYIDPSDIALYVDGVSTTFTFTSSNTISVTTAPTSGAIVRIERTTNSATRSVDFSDGSILTEADLDMSAQQVFNLAQEAIDTAGEAVSKTPDGKMDAQNRVIKNVATAVNADEAVNKGQIDIQYPHISTVATNINDILVVKNDIANVNTTAGSIANVNTVATNIAKVNTVSADIAKVVKVADDLLETVSEIETVADDLNETTSDIEVVSNAIANVNLTGGSIASVNTTAGSIASVNSVAGNAANINSVKANEANINAVNANKTNIDAVKANEANINAVKANEADITLVAGNNATISAVHANKTNIDAVHANKANIDAVQANEADITAVNANKTNIDAVKANEANINAVNSNKTNIDTIATGMGLVTTVANDLNETISEIETVANDLNETLSEIEVVGANIANVNLVAGSNTSINTVASNIAGVNSFGERYRVSATAPTASTDAGDLFFDTAANMMKVYGTAGWQNAGSSVNGTSERKDYTVGTAFGTYTGSTTVFPVTYDTGYLDVYLNGVKLMPSDYTATNGTSVTLVSAGVSGDTLSVVSYGTFALANIPLGSLSTVDVPAPSDNQSLVYNATTSKWEATTLDSLPSQSGHSGKHLSTDGTNASWAAVDSLDLQDNEKIKLGNSDDLQIYHDGSNSRIRDVGTGGLSIGSSTVLELMDEDFAETYIQCNANSDVKLYHNNSQKLATTSSGIDVTGTVAATAFTGDGSGLSNVDPFPSGTKMIFNQASAPTGWTKSTTHNDRVLRVVSGAGGGTGGSGGFASARSTQSGGSHNHGHNLSAAGHTLSTSQMPSHSHTTLYNFGDNGGSGAFVGPRSAQSNSFTKSSNNTGGSGSHSHSVGGGVSAVGGHSHTIDAPSYIDVIVCSKD